VPAGYISRAQLEVLAPRMTKSTYGNYLKFVLESRVF
jgi:hypothetical protein